MAKKSDNTVLYIGGAAALAFLLWPSGSNAQTNINTANPNSTAPQNVIDFINAYNGYAQTEVKLAPNPGISAAFILAQAGLESAWGTSDIAVNANNFFGIKASTTGGDPWTGATYSGYRKYPNVAASFDDYLAYLLANNNYNALWNSGTNDAVTWANLMGSTGYSEDPKYTAKLLDAIALINNAIT